jgi:hypothetical protein
MGFAHEHEQYERGGEPYQHQREAGAVGIEIVDADAVCKPSGPVQAQHPASCWLHDYAALHIAHVANAAGRASKRRRHRFLAALVRNPGSPLGLAIRIDVRSRQHCGH